MTEKASAEEKALIAESSREGGDGLSDAQLAQVNLLREQRGEPPLEVEN
jgi:hypothetical protein